MAKRTALGKSGLTSIESNLGAVLESLKTVNKSVANLKAVKKVKAKSKYKGVRPVTKTTAKSITFDTLYSVNWKRDPQTNKKTKTLGFEEVVRYIVEDATMSLKGKARTWAIETLQMMKALAPLRTENLMQSIKILSDEKAKKASISNRLEANGLLYVVGIDEEAILPPPQKKKVKHGKQTGRWVVMPSYNYAKDADEAIKKTKGRGYQGYDFLRRWQQVAKENMERIFR